MGVKRIIGLLFFRWYLGKIEKGEWGNEKVERRGGYGIGVESLV